MKVEARSMAERTVEAGDAAGDPGLAVSYATGPIRRCTSAEPAFAEGLAAFREKRPPAIGK